jgi:hypothetical protein
MKNIRIGLLGILIVFVYLVTLSQAETVPINWQSNSTSSSGNIADSSCYLPVVWEDCRLWNGFDGSIEGTVYLPFYSTWDINFNIKTDTNYSSVSEYVRIYLNSNYVGEYFNYPLSHLYNASYSIEGDSFTYRLEFHSPNYPCHAHLIVTNGTVSSAVQTFSCVGFEPPMDQGPVTAKKNRALPLKAQLYRADGSPVAGMDVAVAPAIQVYYDPGTGEEPTDVTDQALSVGQGTEGNQFVYTEDEKWQFNLKIKNFTSPGTYSVLIVTGDPSEYLIDSNCYATFIIK